MQEFNQAFDVAEMKPYRRFFENVEIAAPLIVLTFFEGRRLCGKYFLVSECLYLRNCERMHGNPPIRLFLVGLVHKATFSSIAKPR